MRGRDTLEYLTDATTSGPEETRVTRNQDQIQMKFQRRKLQPGLDDSGKAEAKKNSSR